MIGGGIGSAHGSLGFSLSEDFVNATNLTGFYFESIALTGYITA